MLDGSAMLLIESWSRFFMGDSGGDVSIGGRTAVQCHGGAAMLTALAIAPAPGDFRYGLDAAWHGRSLEQVRGCLRPAADAPLPCGSRQIPLAQQFIEVFCSALVL